MIWQCLLGLGVCLLGLCGFLIDKKHKERKCIYLFYFILFETISSHLIAFKPKLIKYLFYLEVVYIYIYIYICCYYSISILLFLYYISLYN